MKGSYLEKTSVSIALILSISIFVSCASPAPVPPAKQPSPPTIPQQPVPPPPSPRALVAVTNLVFHDYNGNGSQDPDEPPIEGIKLTYQPGDASCTTGIDGKGIVNIPMGEYKVSISTSSGKFRYILPSVSEIISVKDGLKVAVDKDKQFLVPLVEGFFTLPIPKDVKYTIAYFDVDKRSGTARNWKGEIISPTYDKHIGTDFMVKAC